MPTGTVRVYQQDNTGAVQFIGEDSIAHTPKNETIRLSIGQSFDVRASRIQTMYKALGQNIYEVAYKMEIRNHHNTSETVVDKEQVNGSFSIVRSSVPFSKEATNEFRFKLVIPANSTKTVTWVAKLQG